MFCWEEKTATVRERQARACAATAAPSCPRPMDLRASGSLLMLRKWLQGWVIRVTGMRDIFRYDYLCVLLFLHSQLAVEMLKNFLVSEQADFPSQQKQQMEGNKHFPAEPGGSNKHSIFFFSALK